MDGWITIGTDIDSQEFDKEIKRLQKESEKFAKEEEKLLNKKAKLEVDTSKSQRELDNLSKKIDKVYDKLKKEKQELSSVPSWQKNTPTYTKKSTNINKTQENYDSLMMKHTNLHEKYKIQSSNLELINQKLAENSSHQSEINNKIQEAESKTYGLKLNHDSIGKSLLDNIKKVGKWAMAIFSLRTAYSVVRQAMSTISQYNDDINNKLYSVKLIFASALEPIITRLVNLVWKLMGYIAYIAKAWFGIDLLANASANSMKAGASSAEKMKKSLAGFDEMNILNENGTTGSLGATSTPKFEMPENVEIPSWVDWIAKNKDKVLGFFTELGIIIGGIKLAKFFLQLKDLAKVFSDTTKKVNKTTSTMKDFGKALGTGLIITGVLMITKAVTDLIMNWDELTPAQKRADIALLLLGASFTVLGFTIRAAIDAGTFGLAEIIGLITALGLAIGGLIAAIASQEKAIKSVEQAEKDLKTAQDELKKATDDYVSTLDAYDNALKKVEESTKILEEAEKRNHMSGEELFNQVKDGTLKYQEMNEQQKEVYKAYMNNVQAQEDLKKSTYDLEEGIKSLTESKEKEKISSWESKLAVMAESEEFSEYKEAVVEAFESGELSAEEARDLIGKSMSEMGRDTQEAFMQDIPDAIKDGLDPKKYETVGQRLSKWFDDLIGGIRRGWNNIWGNVSISGNIFGGGGGGGRFAKGGVVYPKLQYCANGAIINQPGRGVPITQAVGGERGQEGILPLTDSQQMDLLGSAIARHMNINATIPIYIGNRQIAREIQKINAQQEFVMNN